MNDESKTSFVDVSHEVEDGMITYRGLPAPLISDYLSREESRKHYSEGTEFHIGRIELVANTGTYLDSPYHRYGDGRDLAQLPLSSIADLDGVCIRARNPPDRSIDPAIFRDVEIKGKAVLIETGWDVHWRSEQYFEGHPFLMRETAQFLADAGARLVGIDSYNIDDTRDGSRPAHSILLRADIPIVEHLCNLQSLPASGFRFFSVPVKVKSFGTFPVRAFAVIKDR